MRIWEESDSSDSSGSCAPQRAICSPPYKAFRAGFGVKCACPKASWDPYHPFPMRNFPLPLMGYKSLHKSMLCCFMFCFRTGGRSAVRAQIQIMGRTNWDLGLSIPKLHTKKACRIQWSAFHSAPYVASNGLQPPRAHPSTWCQIWLTSAGQSLWIWQNLDPRILGCVEPVRLSLSQAKSTRP